MNSVQPGSKADADAATAQSAAAKGTFYCSFCGKSEHEVCKLIASRSAFICDECIALCAAIMFDHGQAAMRAVLKAPSASTTDDSRESEMNPNTTETT